MLQSSEIEPTPLPSHRHSSIKSNAEKDSDRQRPGSGGPRRHQSIKERRHEQKLEKLKIYDPPTITTTAATPQDSPNTTLELGASMKDWELLEMESLEAQQSQHSTLLTPPSVFGSLKALDDRLFFERPSSSSLIVPSADIGFGKISCTGSANILPTCVEQSGDEQSAGDQPVIPSPIIPSPTPSR